MRAFYSAPVLSVSTFCSAQFPQCPPSILPCLLGVEASRRTIPVVDWRGPAGQAAKLPRRAIALQQRRDVVAAAARAGAAYMRRHAEDARFLPSGTSVQAKAGTRWNRLGESFATTRSTRLMHVNSYSYGLYS